MARQSQTRCCAPWLVQTSRRRLAITRQAWAKYQCQSQRANFQGNGGRFSCFVAASRQSAAICDGNSDGGFMPKAATLKRTRRAFRIPHWQLVAPKSDEGGRELFSCIHFGMDERGNWRLNLWRKKP
jgi:hypothetical protein